MQNYLTEIALEAIVNENVGSQENESLATSGIAAVPGVSMISKEN